MDHVDIIITLSVAAIGGTVFLKLKLPAGPVIGAMLFVMALSILWGRSSIPWPLVILARIIAGTLIGCRIHRSSLSILKGILSPMFFFSFFMLALSMGAGLLIYNICDIHKATALFGSAPGGVTDMSLISADYGAEMPKVALLQTVRIFACITIIPFVVKKNLKRTKNDFISAEVPIIKYRKVSNPARIAAAVIAGTIGGSIGHFLSIPAGALIGAVFFVALFNMIFFRLYIPTKVSIGAQMLVGAVIGAGMTLEALVGLRYIILPALLVAVFLISIGLLLALCLNRIWNINMNTAIIATAPGGMTEMSLIAADVGADVSIVASLHLIRLIALLMIYPAAMKLII
jgi:uncharacterized protein